MTRLTQYVLLAIFVIIGLSSCQSHQTSTKYVIGDDKSYLLLGSDVTEQELEDIASDFKSLQDIDIDFDGTLYDDEGKVINLNLKVSTKNGEGEITNATRIASAGFIVDDYTFQISNNLSL